MKTNGGGVALSKEEVVRDMTDFVLNDAANRCAETGGRYFDAPLVRFAAADDPLFGEFTATVGPEHLTPGEAFEKEHGAGTFPGGTVISIALPLGEALRAGNRPMRDWPSRDWTRARSYGDPVVCGRVGAHLVERIAAAGGRATLPGRAKWFAVHRTPAGPYSVWSERHIAYAAGHGTFSLNDGFITERGMAVRFVSAVTDLAFPPDRRTAENHLANCLFHARGVCGACIKRCPVNAISEKGHDKIVCYRRCYGEEARAMALTHGALAEAGTGCGLCQTGVPCESGNPMAAR